MAAITPHLEEQNDPSETPEEEAWFNRRYDLSLGRLQWDEGDGKAGLANRALQVSHSNLMATAWTRRILEEQLVGNSITVTTKGRDVILELAHALGKEPRFNPPGAGTMRSINLLAWTRKMGAPSFSLPAGPPQFGGSCPGATGGQSIVPTDQLNRAARHVEKIINEPIVLPDCVCQWCYAEGGNYRYGSKQLGQVVLFAWAQQALQDNTFVEVMDWAVKNANYKLNGVPKDNLPAERHPGRFFRIHDSGDFFSLRYLEAWKAVAELNPDIIFWAPTRLWALPRGAQWVNDVNSSGHPNLIIRPSAYMVDRPKGPEFGPGWARWSVVYDSTNKPEGGPFFEGDDAPYNWDCQAYAVEDEKHNCRLAKAPDGEVGCRACWNHPEATINYTKH